MEDSGSLILSVAGRGKSWKVGEEDGAVGDVAGGRNSVSQDIGGAAVVLVITVGGGGSSGAATVAGNCCQARGDRVLGGSSGRLEVGAQLGASARCRSSRGSKLVAVGQSSADGTQLSTSATGANRSTLGQVESLSDLGSLSTINSDGELLRVIRESTRQLSGVFLGIGDQTGSKNLEVTTIVERVKSSSLDSNFLGLSGLEGDEVLSSQAGGQQTKFDAFEGNLGSYTVVSVQLL